MKLRQVFVMTVVASAMSLLVTSAVHTQEPPTGDLVPIGQSGQYSTGNNKPQRFMDYIEVGNGDAGSPLTLKVNNGTDVSPGFNWFRISIAGRDLFMQTNAANKKEFVFDLSGRIDSGTSQIVVDAGGVPGASLSWVVLAKRSAPVLQSAQPTSVGPGENLVLNGKGFAPTKDRNYVKLSGTPAVVVSATPTSITATVPKQIKAGDYKVTIGVGDSTSNPVVVKVIAVPELQGLSLMSGPPGQDVVITGTNFSPNISDNQVLFGSVPAQITQASPTSLSVIIPELENPQFGVPVSVKVSNVRSKNFINIDIYNRVF